MQHINVAKIDTVFKGINTAPIWEAALFHIFTDSVYTNGSQTPFQERLEYIQK